MRAAFENASTDAHPNRTRTKRDLIAVVELDAAETRLLAAEAGIEAITAQATAAERQIGVTGEANPQVHWWLAHCRHHHRPTQRSRVLRLL